MAPTKPPSTMRTAIKHPKRSANSQQVYRKYLSLNYVKFLLFDPTAYSVVTVLILLAEFLINIFVIWRVPYTEIDWIAYMQECEGFLNGTTNYAELRGDTGPLVYPAAFVYIYSAFYFLTSQGKNVRLAQYIFMFIYLFQMYLVLRLYAKSRKVPPYVLMFLAFTSYRVHSIYVLRLFNDPVAILFAYIAINCFMDGRFTVGSVFFSLGVGVKMNILLFAPALLLFYLTNLGLLKTIVQLAICGVIQLLLGAPFLLSFPVQYIKGSFDLGRIFEHQWTVNYRFLPREYFELRSFHYALLFMHLIMLLIFAFPSYVYYTSFSSLRALQEQLQPQLERRNSELRKKNVQKKPKKKDKQDNKNEELTKEQQQFLKSFEKSLQSATGQKTPNTLQRKHETTSVENTQKTDETVGIHFDQCTQLGLLPFFISNFVGVVFARSLHYQFYVWYYHSLPYLLFCTHFNNSWRFLILGLLELCWNTYPSTDWSSYLLHACHLLLLGGLFHYCYGTLIKINKLRAAQNDQQKTK